jgi:predicted secreted protein
MKRIVVQAAMVRPAASSLLLAVAMAATPVLAGDRALIDYIGYSEDGRYFAFEEYGVQDGSGFAYSTIYVIDLPADKWVTGAPYRAVLENEELDVGDARDAAFELAEAKLDELGIDDDAFVVALNGDGDARTGDGTAIDFGQPGFGMDPVATSQTLTLGVFPRAPGEDCAIIENKTFGFSLALDGTEIYADADPLPKSRGCAMGYRIHAVVRPAEWSMATGGTVAIVSAYPFGFEGPNRRFIAVPLGQ